MKIIATATPSGFQPQPEYWDLWEEKIHIGQDYQIDVKQPRSLGHHRKFYALLKVIFDMQDRYDNIEDLRTELKLRTGHYKEHLNVKGNIMYIPKSLSFADTDQVEFESFYSKCIDVALKYFIPKGMSEQELENCVNVVLQFG